jgi:hypothetical protein
MAASDHPVGIDHPTIVPTNFEADEEGMDLDEESLEDEAE